MYLHKESMYYPCYLHFGGGGGGQITIKEEKEGGGGGGRRQKRRGDKNKKEGRRKSRSQIWKRRRKGDEGKVGLKGDKKWDREGERKKMQKQEKEEDKEHYLKYQNKQKVPQHLPNHSVIIFSIDRAKHQYLHLSDSSSKILLREIISKRQRLRNTSKSCQSHPTVNKANLNTCRLILGPTLTQADPGLEVHRNLPAYKSVE